MQSEWCILAMFSSIISTAYAAEEATGGGLTVKLAPYILGHVGNLPITATLVTTWLAMAVLVIFAIVLRPRLKLVPGRLQTLVELVIGGAYDYVAETLESRKLASKYFPILMTIFLGLLVMNWTGLLPGVTSVGFWEGQGADKHLVPLFYPPAADLNLAIAYAFIAMVVVEFAGIAALGVWRYGGKFINFSGRTIGQRALNFVVGIIELISELGRLISFSFRLFGNIFAGKTLLVVALFFVPLVLPVPILAYEVFVGFIQAAIFAFLTLIFIKLAVAEPHH